MEMELMSVVDDLREKVEAVGAKIGQLLERETPAGKWLSVAESAEYAAHSSDDTIRRLIAEGRLSAHRLRPGKLLIDRDELDAVIRSMRDAKPRRRKAKAQT